jgi:CRP-like cAMP-binding protein
LCSRRNRRSPHGLGTRPHPLVRKLESITDLAPEERQALLDLPMRVQAIGADQDIVREGDRPSRCCLVLQGFTCRYKMTLPGKRQIMAFHIAGDIPDLQSLHLATLDHSLGTITPCEVGFINHEDVHDLIGAVRALATCSGATR